MIKSIEKCVTISGVLKSINMPLITLQSPQTRGFFYYGVANALALHPRYKSAMVWFVVIACLLCILFPVMSFRIAFVDRKELRFVVINSLLKFMIFNNTIFQYENLF